MIRLFCKLLPVLVLVGGYYFLRDHKIDGVDDLFAALKKLIVKPRDGQPAGGGPIALPPVRAGNTIRIASFNIQVFGETKLADPKTADILARIVRKFDVAAIQEIRAKDPNLVARFVQLVNAGGVQYSYAVGPRLGDTDSKEQYAFVYDLARVEIDPTSVYTVGDPGNAMHREPLVAGFRARGAPPQEAFTFTLVNVHTDPDHAAEECDVLAGVFRGVREDGRGEDDVILLGDFNADETRMHRLRALPNLTFVIGPGIPTNTRGTQTYDNVLFDRRATVEFVPGSYGVLDVMREFNLTLDEALKVSDHLPVFAELSVYEGGRPGAVAARAVPAPR